MLQLTASRPGRVVLALRPLSVFSRLRRSHYDALGVSPNATQADIKAAYYKLSMVYHPDKNESAEAAKTFRDITEAYEVIGNFKLRKMYDKGLLGHVMEDSTRRSYSNYNPSASSYKNKPTHHQRSNVYNFDEWSRFHYGDMMSRKQEAKEKYERKMNQRGNYAQTENTLVMVILLTSSGLLLSYMYRKSLDEPRILSNEKKT